MLTDLKDAIADLFIAAIGKPRCDSGMDITEYCESIDAEWLESGDVVTAHFMHEIDYAYSNDPDDPGVLVHVPVLKFVTIEDNTSAQTYDRTWAVKVFGRGGVEKIEGWQKEEVNQ